jgi:hypothetical protein
MAHHLPHMFRFYESLVSNAIFFSLQENYGDADGLFYNANAPSRLNPRIPKMRANIHGDEGSEDANLESYDADKYLATEPGDNDEGAAVEDDNSSLWIDPRKTPMDRIQV